LYKASARSRASLQVFVVLSKLYTLVSFMMSLRFKCRRIRGSNKNSMPAYVFISQNHLVIIKPLTVCKHLPSIRDIWTNV